jgi:hypothetical protein
VIDQQLRNRGLVRMRGGVQSVVPQ